MPFAHKAALAAAVVVATCAGVALWTRVAIAASEARVAESNAALLAMQRTVAQLPTHDALVHEQLDAARTLLILKKLDKGRRASPAAWLEARHAASMAGVVLRDYREQGGYADMRVMARDNADISEFMRTLQKTPLFFDVSLQCFWGPHCHDAELYAYNFTDNPPIPGVWVEGIGAKINVDETPDALWVP